MIPSVKLRKIISKNHKINLDAFSWNKEFNNNIFKITFYDGRTKTSLKKIFENGYNIGNCLLTSYYVINAIENAYICTGKVEILKGTKNSKDGDHVWIENDSYIIDTTLMICIPKYNVYSRFYKKDSIIVPSFSTSELNYLDEYYSKENYPSDYYIDLFKTDSYEN